MSSFHFNTKTLTRAAAALALLVGGWHNSVVAQPAALEADADFCLICLK